MTTVELPKSSQSAVYNTINSDPIQSVEMLSVDDILNDLQQKTDVTNAQLNTYRQSLLQLLNNQTVNQANVLNALSQLSPEALKNALSSFEALSDPSNEPSYPSENGQFSTDPVMDELINNSIKNPVPVTSSDEDPYNQWMNELQS